MDSLHLARNCSCLASLTFLLLESASVWSREYECIWKSRSSCIKWLYLFSRYVAIATQMTTCILLLGPLSPGEIPPRTCEYYFAYLITSILFLYLALEATLIIRVWALYRQDKAVRTFLTLLFTTSVFFDCACSLRTFLKLRYNPQCIAYNAPKAFAFMSGFISMNQVLLMLLTMYKKHIAEREGWHKSQVVQILIRDSGWIFAAMAVIIAVVSPYTFKVNIPAHFMLAWPITLVPIMTCRIILNMSTLNTPEAAVETELSTNVNIDISSLFSPSLSTTNAAECPR